jgi:hypothetical protein
VTPFTLAGAMAPVTMVGAVTQSIAEALAAIVLLQCVNPGVGVGIGTFTSNVDMKTGAPAFGTPDYVRATQMTGQMARFYGLPLRSSNTCAANTPDNQATWESMMSMWAVVTSGTNMVYHAAGWLEGGLCASFEKFVMDCEVLQQFIAYMKPLTTGPEDIAVDAIREVGPGGHFFGIQHTQDRYENAFYSPFLSDWSNYENWEDRGAVTTVQRANTVCKNPRRIRGAADGRGDPRGAGSLRRAAQGRGRRADGFLRRTAMRKQPINAPDAPQPSGGYAQALELAGRAAAVRQRADPRNRRRRGAGRFRGAKYRGAIARRRDGHGEYRQGDDMRGGARRNATSTRPGDRHRAAERNKREQLA